MKLARLAPLVLIALVGCSPSPTTAAQVGDATISQQRVADLVAGCPSVQENEVTEAVALTFLVRTEIFKQVGADNGIEMSDDTLRESLMQEEGVAEFVGAQPECIDILFPQAASALLGGAMSEEQAGAELGAVEVQVNPRQFGWDASQAIITEESGSLSIPGTTE